MKPIQNAVQPLTPSATGGPVGAESDREELLKTTLSEPHWQQEACKSALRVILKKGALIVALFSLCAVLNAADAGVFVPTLIFTVGATVILLWRAFEKPSSD